MTLPPITVLIPTYGRTKLLTRAIASALAQDYAGGVVVHVLNDFPRQTLTCDLEAVWVVNTSLYGSLGQKRNALSSMVVTPWAYFLDDDDIIMPWCFSSRLDGAPPDANGVTSRRNFHMLGDELSPSGGAAMDFLFRSRAVGMFEHKTNGEDQGFRATVPGGVLVRDVRPSHAYCWGNGVCHVSGVNDKEDHIKRKRFLDDATDRVGRGEEPTGIIHLKPTGDMLHKHIQDALAIERREGQQ